MKRLGWVLAGVLLLVFAAAAFWILDVSDPLPEALEALQSDAQVVVETEPWLGFSPAGSEPESGLIFYPGGKVDPQAYAVPARQIAEAGYLVVIPTMPFNLAVLAPDRADEVIAAFPQIDNWAVGGHSLGGSMAARYAGQNPDRVNGLVLWASFPAGSDDLSGSSIEVVSIYGTKDGLITLDEIEASRSLLPAETFWEEVEGGNHAQFASYGLQANDEAAMIARSAQQKQTVAATLALLERLSSAP